MQFTRSNNILVSPSNQTQDLLYTSLIITRRIYAEVYSEFKISAPFIAFPPHRKGKAELAPCGDDRGGSSTLL